MFGGQGPTDLLPWLQYYSGRAPYGIDGPQSLAADDIALRSDDGKLTIVHGAKHRADK
jgi:hypothetical protein